jgi:hypothetical protein
VNSKSKIDRFKSKNLKTIVVNAVDQPQRRGKKNGFVQITLKAAAEISRKMRNYDLIILSMLIYRVYMTGSVSFTLSNDLPRIHGVGKMAKHRALARFEEAGIIRIERFKGRAPVITLLVKID